MEWVRRLAGLEEHIGVLGGPAEHRMIGREGALPMRPDEVVVDEFAQHLVRERTDHVHLMRSPEPVEEMQERHPRLERRGMRDHGEVHRFLNAGGTQHRKARGAGEHDVAVIPEDRQSVSRERAGGNVEHRGCEFTRDLKHVRDLQEQSLRRRERAGQRACLQCAMHSPGGTAFALHLDHRGNGAPQVLDTLGSPLVAPLTHVRRWRDRVNPHDLR